MTAPRPDRGSDGWRRRWSGPSGVPAEETTGAAVPATLPPGSLALGSGPGRGTAIPLWLPAVPAGGARG
jgi:hypothetical protein